MTIQRTLNFDMATLANCINKIQPPRLRTVSRGLLSAAAHQPWLVSDIDADGCLIMEASIPTVAAWAQVSPRAIQINVCRLKITHPKTIEQTGEVNTPSTWLFSLAELLPESSIDWFIDLVETSKSSPRTFQKFTPNKSKVHPELSGKFTPSSGVNSATLSSSSLVLITASLAQLAGCCEKSGIAMSCSQDNFGSLQVDPQGLKIPAVVEAVYQLAVETDLIKPSVANRRRVFVSAAIATRPAIKFSWSYFRDLITTGNFATSTASNAEFSVASQMLRSLEARAAMPAQPSNPPSLAAVCVGDTADAHLAATEFGQKYLKRRQLIGER